ncbi:hypothetical protein FIBSPDRAFT_830755 [Athelia psychrophila]|uniref:GILT-domain-containing protein n=1 Tax=Athelia psychrophila TaxID=1759441 RepID=A0A166FY01_9AGAM|nr:hypothetical protein FIBSPDRAFT_830755 [Fibularhizoctonia sp. CBS 109695]
MTRSTMFYSLGLFLLPTLAVSTQQPFALKHGPVTSAVATNIDIKVPVKLGVMSACPDALVCEAVFDKVLEQVREIVDINLTYIAKLNSSEPDFGVTCMHGTNECAGNVQQLCTAKYADPIAWWRFVQCQNFEGRYRVGLPEVALNCASAAGIDWEGGGSGECAGVDGGGKGAEGVLLLQKNVEATEKLGVRKSCTVLINGRPVCVHDSEWKDCEAGHTVADFVQQIRKEYVLLNRDENA